MRWIALVLLVANLGVAGSFWLTGTWVGLFRTPELAAPPRPASWLRAARLNLATESSRVRPRSPAVSTAVALERLGERCVRVGPFATAAAAAPLRERLGALGVVSLAGRSEIADASGGNRGGLIVRLLDIATIAMAERTVRELRALDIEAFVISEGQHAPGVSLGLFPTSALAEARIREAEALGFPSVATPVAGTRVLHWLLAGSAALADVHPGTLSESDWRMIRTGFEAPCTRIAAEIGLE